MAKSKMNRIKNPTPFSLIQLLMTRNFAFYLHSEGPKNAICLLLRLKKIKQCRFNIEIGGKMCFYCVQDAHYMINPTLAALSLDAPLANAFHTRCNTCKVCKIYNVYKVQKVCITYLIQWQCRCLAKLPQLWRQKLRNASAARHYCIRVLLLMLLMHLLLAII